MRSNANSPKMGYYRSALLIWVCHPFSLVSTFASKEKLFPTSVPSDKIVVRIGAYDFFDSNPVFQHTDVRIAERIIHPNYSHSDMKFLNDLALLKLVAPVTLAPHIIPACLAPYKNYTGTYGIWSNFWVRCVAILCYFLGTIAGWGRLFPGMLISFLTAMLWYNFPTKCEKLCAKFVFPSQRSDMSVLVQHGAKWLFL